MNAQQPSSILKLEPNVPTEITLATNSGLEVRGNFGPQMLFLLAGGGRLCVPIETGREIQSLTLAPGAPFILTKRSRGQTWKVERKPIQSPAPARPTTQLEAALKTAIAAAKEAEHYGQR